MRKMLLALVVLIAVSTAVYAEENQTDPCANVQCNSPPATTCEGSSVKTYSSAGTCSGGTCSYSSSLTSCPNGCENGVCKANFCDTATCSSVSKTCPDGFTTSCTQTCDRTAQSCTACEPSCAGHETASGGSSTSSNGTTSSGGSGGASNGTSDPCSSIVCNTPPTTTCDGNNIRFFSSPGACNNGACSYPETGYACQNGCSNGECVNGTSGSGGGTGPLCEAIQTLGVDGSGRCSTFPSTCLPPGWTRVETCPQQTQQQCPQGCECKYDDKGNVVGTYCTSERRCNYNNVCDKDEGTDCRDCIGGECPVSKECPDGSKVNCYKKESGCDCGPCPISESDIPSGCRQEADANGFIRVICEQEQVKCSSVPQDVRIKCADEGGTPRFSRDSRGCNTFQCDFGGQRTNSPVFATVAQCPSPEEVSHSLEKCKEFGLEGAITFEGGCKIGKCVQESSRARECPNPAESEKMAMEEKCRAEGLGLVFEFDGQCHQPKCGTRQGQGCQRDLPKESYDKCAENGGQLVVRRNNDGCVAFSNCLKRGDSSESFVGEVDEIPDMTELLSIAFKLEDLKLDLDKLAKKTNDIADYYKSTGSTEENRFRRVSDMFTSAKDKVDEIKTKLRQRADDISKDDVLEIKQDLKYLKDVVIKDILFVMLSSGDEIEEIKSGTTKECGTDGGCFDRAIRVCQPVTFRPEGRNGPIIELKGLEGNACIMYAKLPEGQGPPGGPYDMTCKIEKYSLGVRNPETDIFPYCTGNMVEMIKKYGTGEPGVPGKCSGDECRDYCGRGPTEAKECLQYLDDVLPEDAKQSLEELASGRMQGAGSGFGGFEEGGFGQDEFSSGGEFNSGGGGQLCPDTICDDFEQKNPNACPQDCGGSGSSGEFDDSGGGCPDTICDDFERSTGACPQDCGNRVSGGGSGGGFAQPQPLQPQQQRVSGGGGVQACSGCLNNNVCDPGECSECADCIRE